tara:strand:+ start:482 stop:985 length:504 start_codon:yes stop_codon:yes gene_type:complete
MENLLNSIPELLLFGSVVWFWIMSGLFFLLLIYSDRKEQGYWALVATVIFIVVNHFWGNLSEVKPIITWGHIFAYFGIGFAYATLRTYIYGRKNRGKDERFYALKHLKANVFRWWFLFPISILNWIWQDLLSDIWDLLYSGVEKFLLTIFDAGAGKPKPEEDETPES